MVIVRIYGEKKEREKKRKRKKNLCTLARCLRKYIGSYLPQVSREVKNLLSSGHPDLDTLWWAY